MSITLKNPSFGNTISFDRFTEIRRNQNQGLSIAVDKTWPTEVIHNIEILSLSSTQIDDLLNFMDTNRGSSFNYTDQNNISYLVMLKSPSVSTYQRGPGCLYSASFVLMEVSE
jgi:hypothetical protein